MDSVLGFEVQDRALHLLQQTEPNPDKMLSEQTTGDHNTFKPWLRREQWPPPLNRLRFTPTAHRASGCGTGFSHCVNQFSHMFTLVTSLVYCYSLFISTVMIAMTVIYYEEGHYTGAMPWSFVSVAVVFPITFAIANSIQRRDNALRTFAKFKSAGS